MPQSMDIYRQEIIKTATSRTDLMRWKLILIGAIGSFGFPSNKYEQLTIILMLIPFVCVYVDALCYQQTLKIFLVGEYLRHSTDMSAQANYEQFCQDRGKGLFSLEDVALVGSSVFMCVAIAVYVSIKYIFATGVPLFAWIFVCLASLLGLFISIVLRTVYRAHAQDLHRASYLSSGWKEWLTWACSTVRRRAGS